MRRLFDAFGVWAPARDIVCFEYCCTNYGLLSSLAGVQNCKLCDTTVCASVCVSAAQMSSVSPLTSRHLAGNIKLCVLEAIRQIMRSTKKAGVQKSPIVEYLQQQ